MSLSNLSSTHIDDLLLHSELHPTFATTMVNWQLSDDLKSTALSMWSKGWDQADICDALSISQASLYRWQAIFEEFGTVQKPRLRYVIVLAS